MGLRRSLAALVLAGALVALLLGGVLSQSSGSPVTHGPSHCADVPTGAAPARQTALTIGLNSMWNNDCNLEAATSAGVTFERLEVDWSSIEPRSGHWSFGAYDKLFAIAARHGVTVLPLLMNVPAWAGPAWNALPANSGAYARYVARVVRRYGPHGRFWRAHRDIPARPATWFEIWNEPYLSQFSAGGVNPGRYARLFKAAAMAGRRADPSARFLIEADLSGLAKDGLFLSVGRPHVRGRARPGPLGRRRGGAPLQRDRLAGQLLGVEPARGLQAHRADPAAVRRTRRRLEALLDHGGGLVHLSGRPHQLRSEPDQAAYLKRVFQLVKSDYPWVKAVFPYNYRDGPEGNGTYTEAWFGLIRRAGQPKPAWNVLRAAARG